jgi:hypothetical protein
MASTSPAKEPMQTVNGLEAFSECISKLDKSKINDIHFVFGQLEHVLRIDFNAKQIYCVDRDGRAMFAPLKNLLIEKLTDFQIQDISRNALLPQFMSGAKGFSTAPQTLYAQPKSWIDHAVNTINRTEPVAPLADVTNTKHFKP